MRLSHRYREVFCVFLFQYIWTGHARRHNPLAHRCFQSMLWFSYQKPFRISNLSVMLYLFCQRYILLSILCFLSRFPIIEKSAGTETSPLTIRLINLRKFMPVTDEPHPHIFKYHSGLLFFAIHLTLTHSHLCNVYIYFILFIPWKWGSSCLI